MSICCVHYSQFIVTLALVTLAIVTLAIVTLAIVTLAIVTLAIVTLAIATLAIVTSSITSDKDVQAKRQLRVSSIIYLTKISRSCDVNVYAASTAA